MECSNASSIIPIRDDHTGCIYVCAICLLVTELTGPRPIYATDCRRLCLYPDSSSSADGRRRAGMRLMKLPSSSSVVCMTRVPSSGHALFSNAPRKCQTGRFASGPVSTCRRVAPPSASLDEVCWRRIYCKLCDRNTDLSKNMRARVSQVKP